MLNFCFATVIILGIMLSAYSAAMLIDEFNMASKHGEYSPRSYVIWGLIFMISLSAIIVSWANLEGSKWFVAMYFGPALLLVLLAVVFETRQWFGTTLVVVLCFVWLTLGGFFASASVYNLERNGRLGGNYTGCYYERVAGTMRYEWDCPDNIRR